MKKDIKEALISIGNLLLKKKHIGKALILVASSLYLLCGIYLISVNLDSSFFWKKTVKIESIPIPDLPLMDTELAENNSEPSFSENDSIAEGIEEIQVLSDNVKWVWVTLLQAEIYFMIFAGIIGLIFFWNHKRAKLLFWVGIYMLILHLLDFISWALVFRNLYADSLFITSVSIAVVYITGAFLSKRLNTEN